jgi:hypothetical protein
VNVVTRILLPLAAAWLLAVAAGAAAAADAAAPRSPSLALVALAPKDVGGDARVVRQRSLRSPGYQAAFERELEFRKGRIGRSLLFFLTSTVELARTSATTKAALADARLAVSTRAGRVAVVRAMETELRASLGASLKAAAMGRLRTPRIGQGALVVPISVTTTSGRLQVVVTYVRVDRIFVTTTVVGAPVARVDLDRLLKLTATKATAQLAPILVGSPFVAGVAQAGQVLTASSGSWSNRPTGYAYRWSRCDAAGSGCVVIPGATQPSYTATAVDVGTTLRVTVVARNGAGTTSAQSPPTPVVTPAA